MFWILFMVFIFIGCAISWVVEFFQQMKESEYEIVRILYWILVSTFWITFMVWVWSWQGDQVGKTSKINLASQKKDVILIV